MSFKFDAKDNEGDYFSTTTGLVDEPTMLEALSSAGIIDYEEPDEDGFKISDGCDHYYTLTLGRKELLALSDELREMALQMKA